MKIGTIAGQKYFNGVAPAPLVAKYKSILAEHFSEVGMFAFGQMKFISSDQNPEQRYNWSTIDNFVAYCAGNNITPQYNTLIQSQMSSFPLWYIYLSPKEKEVALKRHLQAILNRYKGKVKVYKLVNEPTREKEENFLGTSKTKTDLIALIFQWAKEYYPEGTFILNEHLPFLMQDTIREDFIKLLHELAKRNTPIDIIGIEGHLGYRPQPFQLPPDKDIHKTLDEVYQSISLPIYITEFDLSYNNAPSHPYPGSVIDPEMPFTVNTIHYKNWYEYQGYAYKHFYQLCLEKGYIEKLMFWGFYDEDYHTWERPGIGFFDMSFHPKPSFHNLFT